MTRNNVAGRPEHVDVVFDLLEELWGNERKPPHLAHEEPLDGLVLTLLSQNTNDKNRDRGFAALKACYPRWDMVAETTREEIADRIRPSGLANTKSERMLLILEKIQDSFGEYSLKELRKWSNEKIRNYLSSLPGIGAKTVACVTLFDLGRPAFPVDTHVSRFCRRMNWVAESLPPAKMQPLLEEWVPPARYLGGHVNIIEHGRRLCRSRNPECGKCPIVLYCPFGKKDGASV